jgi:predicted O-methyltransferase YrrM
VTRAAEIGAGSVVDTAWIATALRPGVPFFTVASDPANAAAASSLFEDDPETTVLTGPWRAVLETEAPFDLIVVRDLEAKAAADDLIAVAAPRATLVVEEIEPARSDPNAACQAWLEHERLDAVRLGVGAAVWVVVAVVRG